MSDDRATKLFELDDQITRLQSELQDLSERAAAAKGPASEERLNDMIAETEAKLAAFRETRAAAGAAPQA